MVELRELQIQHTMLHSHEYLHVDSPFFSSLSCCGDTSVAVGARGFGIWSGAKFYDRSLHWS